MKNDHAMTDTENTAAPEPNRDARELMTAIAQNLSKVLDLQAEANVKQSDMLLALRRHDWRAFMLAEREAVEIAGKANALARVFSAQCKSMSLLQPALAEDADHRAWLKTTEAHYDGCDVEQVKRILQCHKHECSDEDCPTLKHGAEYLAKREAH